MPYDLANIGDYYRQVRSVLAQHLHGRQVMVRSADGTQTRSNGAWPAGLAAGADSGAVQFFLLAPGWVAAHAVPGDGSDIANTATAVLYMAEAMIQDGLDPVPLTDGSDGLLLFARTDGDPQSYAARYAASVATSAPELATQDPAQADGRALVDVSLSKPGVLVPAPYTLLTHPGGFEAVIPLHLDEVAAITAGMPSEITGRDVAVRLAGRGDLASALLAGARPA